jgi:hypothetical protein
VPTIRSAVPFSYWHQSAFSAEIEDSFARESERMASDDEAEHGERVLDAEEIEGILRDLVDEEAVLDAADEDYVCGFAHAVSAKAKFKVELKRRKGDPEGSKTRLIDRAPALRLACDEAADDAELASEVEARFEEWLEEESFKLAILDYVACSTDALMCDRLLNMKEFRKRARRMRREKHGPPARAPRRKHTRGRLYISGQGELALVARPLGKLN